MHPMKHCMKSVDDQRLLLGLHKRFLFCFVGRPCRPQRVQLGPATIVLLYFVLKIHSGGFLSYYAVYFAFLSVANDL